MYLTALHMQSICKGPFSRLVDAVPLSPTCQVTASCICTLPLAIVAQDVGGDENHNKPPYVGLQVDGAKSCIVYVCVCVMLLFRHTFMNTNVHVCVGCVCVLCMC